ncbi:MAG: hypothetical protein J0M26_20430 [Planctomycetes bacterium]|nr:hypothetical protein [Planctomycetota bacterium]
MTLLEVVIASFLVGTFLSLIVAAAGSYQKLHRLNEHKHRELMRVQAFLSDWSQVEFSDEKLAALAVRHRLRILSNAGEKALLSSNELGMMVSPEAKRIPGVLDAELVSIDFWRGDPLLSTWEVTSIEIFRRPHGGQRDETKE